MCGVSFKDRVRNNAIREQCGPKEEVVRSLEDLIQARGRPRMKFSHQNHPKSKSMHEKI